MGTLYGFRNSTGSPLTIGASTVVAPGSSWIFYDASGPYFYDVASIQIDMETNPTGVNYRLATGMLTFIMDSADRSAADFYDFWSTFYGVSVTTATAPVPVSVVAGATVSASKVVTLTGDVTGSGVSNLATSVSRIRGSLIPENAPGALVNDGTGAFTWVRQAQRARRTTVIVPFGALGYVSETAVADTSITTTSVIHLSIQSEDFIIQNTAAHAINVTPGVGYTVIASAPLGATGDLTVHVSIQEGS